MILPAKLAREMELRSQLHAGGVNVTLTYSGDKLVAKKVTVTREESLRLLAEKASYEFKGKLYSLALVYLAIIKWEERTGFGFYADAWRIFDRPSLKAVTAMMFVLLVEAGFEGSYEEVASHLMIQANLRPALDALNAAYLLSQVEAAPGDSAADPQKPTEQ